MTDEIEIDYSPSTPNSSRGFVDRSPVTKTVSIIDHKGRIWTTDMQLPGDTTMDTMIHIAQSNLSLVIPKNKIDITELVVLIEPKDKMQTKLVHAEKVVIIHEKQLRKIS